MIRWWPPAIGERLHPAHVSYIVVEEDVDDLLTLIVSDWPTTDREGRLHFGDPQDDLEVPVRRDEFQRYLAAQRVPPEGVADDLAEEVRRREVKLGDTFAAEVDRERARGASESRGESPLESWLHAPIVDITADARVAARGAFYAATTAPLPERVARELRENLKRRSTEEG